MHCQKCRSILRLDPSLEELNPAAFKLIIDSTNNPDGPRPSRHRKTLPSYQQDRLSEYDSAAQNAQSPIFTRSSQRPGASSQNPNMSFIMLGESQLLDSASPKPKQSERKPSFSQANPSDARVISTRMEASDKIFQILSSRSDIDHPICVECTDLLVEGLQKRLQSVNKERDAYVDFLRQVNADIPSQDEVEDAQRRLKDARKREAAVMADLQALEDQKAIMDDEILKLDAQLEELALTENAFWEERNAHAMDLAAFQHERDRVNTQFEHDTKQLQRLQKANVYNDSFAISHDGPFGTINGLRLGRHSDRPVEWAEINAAWGQTCLLLDTVADRLGFQFVGYQLKPMGSTSKILEIIPRKAGGSSHRSNDSASSERTRVHELYSSGEYSISIGLFNRKFDTAMVAFLECLRQLIAHAQRNQFTAQDGTAIKCPEIRYVIDKDRIGEASIKLGGFNQEEVWTKACKATLICCKYLLAHASNVSELSGRK